MPDNDDGWSMGNTPATQAYSNRALANGVQPSAAINALQKGPKIGVPPSVGMSQPSYVNQAAADDGWSIATQNNPPIATFGAKSPAHAAAAAGSVPQLSAVSQKSYGSFFSDRWNEAHTQALSTWGEIGQTLLHPERQTFDLGPLHVPVSAGITNPNMQALALAFGVRDMIGVAFNAGVGVPAAALGDLYQQAHPELEQLHTVKIPGFNTVFNWSVNPRGLGNISSFAATTAAQIALGSVKVGPRSTSLVPHGLVETPLASADSLARTASRTGTEWNTTADGFLADENGKPIGFSSQRQAAHWRQAFSSTGDQVFELNNHNEGLGFKTLPGARKILIGPVGGDVSRRQG